MPTIFYVIGISLVALAVATSVLGLRNKSFPGSGAAMAGGLVLFVALVGATTTAAVINASHDKSEREANAAASAAVEQSIATKEGQGESGPGNVSAPSGGAPSGATSATPPAAGGGAPSGGASSGGGSALSLSADPTQLAFSTDSLNAKAGKVTIDFDNPAAIQHDVVIEQGAKQVAKTDLIAKGKTSVSADLSPGKYTFFCDVPGHREAGMEGTLTVK